MLERDTLFPSMVVLNLVQRPRGWIWFVKPRSCVLACCCRPPSPPCVIFPMGREGGSSYLCRAGAGLGAGQGPRGQASGSAARDPLGERRCPFPGPVKGSVGGHEATCSASCQVPAGPQQWLGWEGGRCRELTPSRDSVVVVPFGLSASRPPGKATCDGQSSDRSGCCWS